MSLPPCSIVLGTYNRLPFLKQTIETIRNEMMGAQHEIVVVDGGSTDGTTAWLCEQKDVITLLQHNRGTWRGQPIERRSWGYFMNLGFRAASGPYVCMLSDDCLVVPGAIRNGLRLAEEERAKGRKIGAVAFYWRNWPEQSNYWLGKTLGDKMFVNHGLYLKEALEQVKFIDEVNYFFYHADGDLCLKMWKMGLETIESPESFIEHYCNANEEVRASNIARQKQDWKYYLDRWTGIYYSPDEKNDGGWLYKDFADPNKTTDLFRVAEDEWRAAKAAQAELTAPLKPRSRGPKAMVSKLMRLLAREN